MAFTLKDGLSGLISTGIPFIFKGMVNGFLEEKQVTVKIVSQWVIENKDLLTLFKEYGGQDFENALERAGKFVNDSSWLTSAWLIDACREEHPDIASLFLGWEESRVWLDFQTEKFRDAFNKINPPQVLSNTLPAEKPLPIPQRSPNAPLASKTRIKGSENFEDVTES